jgi:molybdopterin-containing oxidoreductase family membrane subunit
MGRQIYHGFGMTGINRPVFWAFYIDVRVLIGISHAGTLISAILRLVSRLAPAGDALRRSHHRVRADDRRDVPDHPSGRPWLFFWLMPYPNQRMIWPNFRSPLVWTSSRSPPTSPAACCSCSCR